ncbi:hypothetical protein Btru_064296 [Bulinus truncatus]|nr:hypothetical protein Btru_064296 [Bulinus truncatus]
MKLLASCVMTIVILVASGQHSDVPICLPYQLLSFFVRFETSDQGLLGLDFLSDRAVKYTISQNSRTVYNLTQRVAYDIQVNTGHCAKRAMAPSEVINRCLPASARQYSPNNSYVGFDRYSLGMQAYEVDLPEGGLARVALTVSEPSFILASQLTGFSSKEIESYFYFNSYMSVEPDLFVVPASCL